jgi:AraC-like DNA-binding protein
MDGEDGVILWVDLTESGGAALLPGVVGAQCSIHHIRDIEQIGSAIRVIKPSLVCFEYDYPDNDGLAALSETKRDYPALPILLITDYHSEALAVWALRARVWDYIVKPYSIEDVLRTLRLLSKVCQQQSFKPRKVIEPVKDSLSAPSCSRLTGKERAVLGAKAYIEGHLDEKIKQANLAKQCGMSLSHFSRAFRQISGVGFSEFLVRTRVEKALHLLADPNSQITSICYEVGFRDLSYFGRIFRRHVGMSPSQYQSAQKQWSRVNRTDQYDRHKLDSALETNECNAQRKSIEVSRVEMVDPSPQQRAAAAHPFIKSPLRL